MLSSLSLLAVLLLQVSTSRASPSVPVSTQAIVTTITAPTVSNSVSTSQTVIESTSSYEDIQTITTVDSNGNPLTTTTDNGPTSTVIEITSDVVVTIPITAYITFESTIGQTTILGPDPTTSSNAPASTAASTTASAASVVNVSPAPAGSTETGTYVSLGITYAPTTASNSDAGSTVTAISSTSGASRGAAGFPTGAPPPAQIGGMSVGAKAAIGTAAIVVSIFLGIFLFWLDRLRRQRNAIREQYPDGQAPGDEAGIFGFFSPIVGKPYDKEDKDITQAEKPPGMDRKPSTMVRDLGNDDITPPAVEEPQQPYRRPIPQRNPYSPHSPISPISPVHDAMPPFVQDRSTYVPDSPSELAAGPFQKGFPRPLGRFPSHHANKSSGNMSTLPEFNLRG